jgi:hypothetical protein
LPAAAIVIAARLIVEEGFAWQWTVWTIVAVWVAKEAVLYPFVWQSHDPN